MRVLITGGVGIIGRAVARRLEECGWEVRLIDIVAESEVSDPRYTMCDIMDFDGLRQQMQGCNAIVHMAALKNPLHGPTQDVFRVNAAGTFNVFEAAAKEGIRRVVQASSINAIGCGFNLTDFLPQYLPIDEDHPSSTTDSYSFSKWVVEDIGAYYWRREGISSTALRFPGVHEADYYRSSKYDTWRDNMIHMLDELSQLPAAEQERQINEVRKKVVEFRAGRPMEFPETTFKPSVPEGINEYLWRAFAFDRFYGWVILDERDAAQSVEKSLNADYEGSHILFINDDHNSVGYDSQTLARLFYPETTVRKHGISGSQALVSIDKARKLIGFEPEYSFHNSTKESS